jgi:ATP-dependent protease ClpP protease subunit
VVNEIRVYGIIGLDVTAQAVMDALEATDGGDVTVRINSRGGNVFEGVAILNALRGHQGRVTTVVDGVAASAASFVAMGGDEIVMNRNAELMIHGSHIQAEGNIVELRKLADNLERINANMASIYAEKAGGTVDDWLAVMSVETWYSAAEAVSAGLADRVEAAAARDGADIAASLDLSMFNYAGRANAPAPRIPQAHNQAPQPVEAEVTKETKEGGLMPTLQEGLAELIGTAPDADDATILAAAQEALAERARDDAEPEPAEPTLEQATAVAAKAGLATITTEALDALQVEARAGAEARAQQVREADERIVDSAITDGKIAPARRDHHLAALKADRDGHTAVLAALQPGIVPMAEVGHGVTSEINNEDDALYTSLFGKGA